MQSREHTGSANYTQRSSAKAALFDYENSRNPSLVIEGLSADIGVFWIGGVWRSTQISWRSKLLEDLFRFATELASRSAPSSYRFIVL